ncbi:set domain protein [Achlya hypogyna]|uniref:Set domain protein n=1 Tax=Achlya hypogyna TaxID=1202772 RepID=A0A1V9ZM34_ACHHY|nr:set domain protein [Achlya hypogyna]
MQLDSAEVEVRQDATRGRGVYAVAKLPANQVILKDSPISVACVEDTDDDEDDEDDERATPLVCCVCKRFVGSVPLQLHYLAGSFQLLAGMCSDDRRVHALPPSLQAMTSQPTLPNLPATNTPVFLTKFRGEKIPSVVCSKLCGEVLHAQPKNVFAVDFQRDETFQALEANLKHLSLATAILAKVYHRLHVQAKSGTIEWNAAVADIELLEACSTIDKALDASQVAAAHSFLLDAFASSKSKVFACFKAHMDLAFFKGLLGRCKVNAVGVDVPSPVVPYFLACEGDAATKAALVQQAAPLLERVLQKLCHQGDDDESAESSTPDDTDGGASADEADCDAPRATAADSDDEDEDIHFVWSTGHEDDGCDIEFNSSAFPSMDGMALFPRFSMLNHSCAPNCGFTYVNETDITVFTTADVAPGEELTISYIERNAPVRARQAELRRRYNFTCACARCTTELAATGKRKAVVDGAKAKRAKLP